MTDYKQVFSQVLLELMAEKDLNNYALSKKIGVANTTVGKWVNQLALPNLKSALKLADFFHTSVDYLFDKTDSRYFFATAEPNFVQNFRQILKDCEVKNKKIFNKCNISNSELYLWQNGNNPSLETLLRFSAYLDLPVEYIIGRTDKTVL